MNSFLRKKKLLLKTLLLVLLIVIAKYAVHYFNLEFIELNGLFTSFVAANVFLLGFLMAGVLTDFKESEKLPGELCVSLESIADESHMLYKTKNLKEAKESLEFVQTVVLSLKDWFHRKERTQTLFGQIAKFTGYFSAFEPHTQANFIVRLKQEQANIRRVLTRIDSIRDTSFISSGYLIAEVNSLLLILALIMLKLDPFSTSMFLTASISLLFIYMLLLIRDLDDPFGFHDKHSVENVSIKTLEDFDERLKIYKV